MSKTVLPSAAKTRRLVLRGWLMARLAGLPFESTSSHPMTHR